eukprot:6480693-Amphidinium_carterae.1
MDEELQDSEAGEFGDEVDDDHHEGESPPSDPAIRQRMMAEGFQLELARLEHFEAFTPCDRRTLNADDRVLGVRWVEKWKKDEGGDLVFRARILSALAVEREMFHFCFDASNAFLHASVGSTRLFCRPPTQWLESNVELLAEMGIPSERCVWRVLRAIN